MPVATDRVGQRAPLIGLLAMTLALAATPLATAQTMEHLRGAGEIRLGYRADARPFSFRDESGQAAGYAVKLCMVVVDQVKAKLGLADLTVKWVPLEMDARFKAVQDGDVDLLCGADSVTLGRRDMVSFSIPIFPSGIGALLRTDASPGLREVLAQAQPSGRLIWRGTPARTVLEQKTFSAVTGTTSEAWLRERLEAFQLDASIAPVKTYHEGIASVLDGTSNVLFGDLPILLDAVARSEPSKNLIVLDRHFTYEQLALPMRRGDEEFRLVVDRALSEFYRAKGFGDFFAEWFGRPDEETVTFFRWAALPE